jgi:hypothetical protein
MPEVPPQHDGGTRHRMNPISHKEAAPMSDLLPYTLLGLPGVLALLGLAGRGADTRDPEFFTRRLTERRP